MYNRQRQQKVTPQTFLPLPYLIYQYPDMDNNLKPKATRRRRLLCMYPVCVHRIGAIY